MYEQIQESRTTCLSLSPSASCSSSAWQWQWQWRWWAIATIRGAAQIPGLLLPQWNGPLRHIISRPSSSWELLNFIYIGWGPLEICVCLHFYRTQVSLGSGLWIPVSLTSYIQHLFETLLVWLWLMMIPTQYKLMMTIGQFGVYSCHVDGGQAQCGLGGHQGGR